MSLARRVSPPPQPPDCPTPNARDARSPATARDPCVRYCGYRSRSRSCARSCSAPSARISARPCNMTQARRRQSSSHRSMVTATSGFSAMLRNRFNGTSVRLGFRRSYVQQVADDRVTNRHQMRHALGVGGRQPGHPAVFAKRARLVCHRSHVRSRGCRRRRYPRGAVSRKVNDDRSRSCCPDTVDVPGMDRANDHVPKSAFAGGRTMNAFLAASASRWLFRCCLVRSSRRRCSRKPIVPRLTPSNPGTAAIRFRSRHFRRTGAGTSLAMTASRQR